MSCDFIAFLFDFASSYSISLTMSLLCCAVAPHACAHLRGDDRPATAAALRTHSSSATGPRLDPRNVDCNASCPSETLCGTGWGESCTQGSGHAAAPKVKKALDSERVLPLLFDVSHLLTRA